MIQEKIFRMLFIFAFITMLVVRIHFQSKLLRDQQRIEIREGRVSLLAGGTLAGNLILAFVPVAMYAILAGIRLGREEEVLLDLFGDEFRAYTGKTGRLLPRFPRQ